ncbi:Sporulation initiation phosphotransferase F [Baekduia alba]|uniref:response regulator n=1 Tax=Baekduia alba TaxID=2997333 RepID=UPI002341D007|nr:response regulator transcription factor [Baekduia alba]WCB95833.1 Sporulation initiation phosphotransferase F [Baekduia alba]
MTDPDHPATTVRVLLADDASEMRALLRWALMREGEQPPVLVVGEAADGRDALVLAVDLSPDVIVLDLQMPGPPPGELLQRMTTTAPGVPIVTFSGFEPDLVAPAEARLVALHIPKTTDLALVRAAIVDVARGTEGA